MAEDDEIEDKVDDGPVREAEVNHCPSCAGEINIDGLAPFTKVECPHCGEPVRVRTQLGNYHIRSLLGEGGMSQVFLAEDLALDRQVALKILHQDLSRDGALMALFEREAKLTASINHPHVVKVYTVGSDGGYFFIAMELVDNVSLEARIGEVGMLPEREALDLLHDVADGLRTAYQGGLIHRDIKPGNILLTKSGTGKLVDFGLALQQGGDDEVEDLWATPFYVPPEKLDGKPDDFRGDIYSLGATFFHALAGRPPFQANTASLEELRTIKARPVSLVHAGAPVSAATIKLIDKMMAYKPDARFKTYDDLLAAIEETQAKLPGNASSRARRKNALGNEKQGLGTLGWLGIAGGAIALVGILIAVIGGNKNGSGNLPDSLNGGTGERVMAAGQENIASRYTQGRDLLLAGRAQEALVTFTDLLKSEDLKQPTRAWTEFNAGLAKLLGGATSGMIVSDSPPAEEGAVEPDQAVAEFVRKAARLINDPLPVLPEAASGFPPNSQESIALLAFGVKNWNHGEFGSAIGFFDAFAASNPPSDVSWIAAYRSLAEPYRADNALLKNLAKPSISQSDEELAALKGKLATVAGSLKTRGGARDLVQRRIKRVDELIAAKKALAAAPPEPVPTTPVEPVPPTSAPPANGKGKAKGTASEIVWTPEAEEEKRRLAEAIGPAVPEMANYRFAEAAEVVRSFQAASDPVKQVQTEYLDVIAQAEAFKARLVAFLGEGEYEGKLLRKAGLPLDAKVISADGDKLVVDLMFGPNDLPWADVAPGWMLAVARESWLKGLPEEATAADWIQAAWFARLTRLKEEAQTMGQTLAPLSPEFAERWGHLDTLP
ncbi:MAG: serine/threonine protein kinase [Verrucomicrobiae bacterium]|nr:serine/threonine protein kinase [Verrucomicrobiae bacterium]